MPIPKQSFSAEQIEKGRQLTSAAQRAGAIEMHCKLEFSFDTKFELIYVDKKRGQVMDQKTFQPTTPEAWVADCKQRGVVAVIPTL